MKGLILNDRKRAFLAGLFILVAYAVLVSGVTDSKTAIVTFEAISGLAVIGIPLMLYKYFKDYSKNVSGLYLLMKIIEGMMMIIGAFLVLSDSSSMTAMRASLYEVHSYVFAASALLLYYLLYGTRILPRWISIWGYVAVVLLVFVNLSTKFEMDLPIVILGLSFAQIVLNEVVMAVILMVKGFKNIDSDNAT